MNRLYSRLRRRVERAIDTWYYRVPPRAGQPWATHLPVLIYLPRLRTIRRVLELGAGIHSTLAFLDRSVFPDLVELRSYETSSEWAERIRGLVRDDNRLDLRAAPGDMASAIAGVPVEGYDLIFVDDSKSVEERVATIEVLAKKRPRTPLVVIHDFENPAYRRASRRFRARYRFSALNPNVGILANSDLDTRALTKLVTVVARNRDRIPASDRTAWRDLLSSSAGIRRA